MYDNEFETKENKIYIKDKIEPQPNYICTCKAVMFKLLLKY